jgi:glycoprotein-N-acetylgalactosamine 3-beta-galactosyltransferase
LIEPASLLNDTYGSLTHKVYFTFRDLYHRYNKYDWYLKADDDTFIFMDNLREFLHDKNASAPVTYGYDFKIAIHHGYHSGGAGYVLSREALMRLGKKLSESFGECSFIGLEDQDVATTLHSVGVFSNKSTDQNGYERFHPFSPEAHLFGKVPDGLDAYAANPVQYGPECCSNTSISFHYMNTESMIKLHEMWKKYQDGQTYRSFTHMLYEFVF